MQKTQLTSLENKDKKLYKFKNSTVVGKRK